ncbi:5-methyltetrahydropteroyltriglutamate--homocysteine S-methyltransferase [Neisseria sp. N95_16]|uniref:5-methyltetrahydropteroyltriglutamate--homocysteine S-methyltransferase n=1 Tax=Neisseria brasiliensis TaxID=2666100 RepID=A0A5Q3RZV7_9NEIS|nr:MULTISPECIES: 5-methyltetrahydropteroyltriglutamate--homocysteine S-methyltransferase [Neisseria]MRN38351.1 5-methyltetrahydropteroyltriglutamate--homocysteine S-methyltransferase [Neisseria brasiliensis]PJO08925.1 5-methyltetrahydropteroyltriglutamate--homocysteine S-methyltransferase [Neisseria sp. N95_16]PJO77644.1 5-methyltetrahydropteroyltriglutamate--homocysteine S-methyltransferase [Neisseria sp. N177_16]QGL25351.1 5-methyltetrahydropteroyltriglutamate--homocysteine S-methyltransferas
MSTLFPNATLRDRAPFRFDIVGSFLRPDALKKARSQCACGECSTDELHQVEHAEVSQLVAKEKAVGLPNVTDGEFRRTWWHLDFLFELLGVELVEAEEYSTQFQAHMRPITLKITDKIEFPKVHPFINHFKALKAEAGDYPVKFTIPSPSMLHLITCVRTPNPQLIERYQDNEELLFADITQAYIDAGNALYAEGCRILQLDDTSWGEFCSEEKRAKYEAQGLDLDDIARKYVKVLNDIRAALPQDMAVTMHICRGNFRSTWFSSGGYEPVAEILFGGCNVDGFFLEYDSDRAGDFKPLRFIKDQQVVLGLITSKSGELEAKEEIIERIKEATQYVDINQLCLSPQCGFASTEEGNELTEEDQWKKLALIRSIVDEVWGSK